jgi:RNA polymerase sigma-70 factor (subfamily 1)
MERSRSGAIARSRYDVDVKRDATDEELARRAKDGDDEAFEALFQRHAPALRRRIQRRLPPLVRRKIDEQDVIQMAYLGVHRGLRSFEPKGDGSFRAWLDQIVEHKILYVVRQYVDAAKRGIDREQTGSFHQRSHAAHGREPSPSGVAVAGELRERIEGALARLPDHYREVIHLVQREGLTLAEAGQRMGRTTAATAKLYGRALAKLADLAGTAGTEA